MRQDDLPFVVEHMIGDEVVEIMAKCTNAIVATGAYNSAVELRKGEKIILRHKSRVIKNSTN